MENKKNHRRISFFSLLFACFSLGELREIDRIHFKDKTLVDYKNSRDAFNERPRAWPDRNEETIVFVEDIDRKNDTDKWNYQPDRNPNVDIYGGNPQIEDTFSNQRGNASGYETGIHIYENNSNRPEENNSWMPSTAQGNHSSSNTGGTNNNGSFSWNNNAGREPERNTDNGNNAKRRLLPEGTCGVDIPRRIIGGTTVDIDEFPWLALLQYRDRNGKISHDCGGSLISPRYVLTAAHCAVGVGVKTRKLKLEKVRLGEWDVSTEKDCQQDICNNDMQDIEIEDVISHSNYRPTQLSQTNDIALLRLKREAEMNQFVQPICLPLDSIAKVNFEGKKVSVAGWGKKSNERNSSSKIKMKVDVPVVAWDNCRSFYESFYNDVKIEKTQMCAGGEGGKDSCQGDSGGPLMSIESIQQDFRWFVIGVVSSGPAACGVEGRPSLYTKVSDYTDWILDNMRD